MRGACAALFLCSTFSAADASERTAALINSFQVMCTLEPLNFSNSDAKAAAMRLPVLKDLRSPSDPSGGFAHSKSWKLPLKTGAHEFTVAEAHGPKGEVKSCGIADANAEPADFKKELVKTMKLGRPIAESTSPDGILQTTTWSYGTGGLQLMFTDRSPRSLHGIYLFLIQKPL